MKSTIETEDYPNSFYIEDDDFESGFNSQWKIDEFFESTSLPYTKVGGNRPALFNSPQIVSMPTESEPNNSAVKFSVSLEDKYDWESEEGKNQKVQVYKSELGQSPVEMNSEYVYSFSNLIPVADEADDSKETIIAQWHELPDFAEGENFRNPPLALMTKGNKFYLSNKWASKKVNTNREIDGEKFFDLGSYEEGQWYEWKINVKWSYQEDGFLEVWKNDELVVRHLGPNTYNDDNGPYLRLGIYQNGGWKNRQATHKELVVDDVQVVKVDETGISEEPDKTGALAVDRATETTALRLEAEDFQLENYAIESANSASGGQLIGLSGSPQNVGTASTTVDDLSGAYDLVVGYFDESDGIAEIQFKLNDKPIDSVLLDRELGSGGVNDTTFQEITIEDVMLSSGDVLTVQGTRDGNELARIDYFDFLPASPSVTDDAATNNIVNSENVI